MLLDLHRTALTTARFRWLAFELVARDVRLRYRGTVLGFVWALLNPLLFMAIYTLVFSVYLHVRIPNYPLYLLCGMIPFNWLASSILSGVSAIPDGRMYVGKTLFPTELLILTPVLSNGVNFIISLALIFVFSLALGVHAGLPLLTVPLIVFGQFLLVSGVTAIVATFNVFFRDLQQLVNYATSALFFITPIFYQRSFVPEKWQFFVVWNPLAALVTMYQSVFYQGVMPSWREMAFVYITGFIAVALAAMWFQRYRDFFGEYV